MADCAYLLAGKQLEKEDVDDFCRELEDSGICQVFSIASGKSSRYKSFRWLWSKGKDTSMEELQRAKALVKPEDASTILFTSGTSGTSKAVVSTHYARMNNGIQQASDLGATSKDHFCAVLPMFHCFCISTNILAALASHACLHILENRHTKTILQAIEKHKCTILNAVPTVFHAMVARPDLKEYDISSLRVGIIGGGTYSPEQFCGFEKTLGMTILSSLGMTEGTAGVTVANIHDPLEVRCTTLGHFMSHVEGKIVDTETGAQLPVGQAGEICIRGYLVMKEYYKAPELTAAAVDPEGWLHTGDSGWVDENGYLHLNGRIKDLVIRGGENISPLEVANYLLAEDEIRDAKVIGVPDEHYGEELCACVVLAEGARMTAAEVRQRVANKLAAFKVPRYVLFFDELPYNTTGKIVTGRLREMVEKRGLEGAAD